MAAHRYREVVMFGTDDLVGTEFAGAVAATAVAFSQPGRRVHHQGAVYGLAGAPCC